MNTFNNGSFTSQVLSNVKLVSFSRVSNLLVSLFKRQFKAAKRPADMEVDNLDWYRTFPIEK